MPTSPLSAHHWTNFASPLGPNRTASPSTTVSGSSASTPTSATNAAYGGSIRVSPSRAARYWSHGSYCSSRAPRVTYPAVTYFVAVEAPPQTLGDIERLPRPNVNRRCPVHVCH